MLVRLFLSWFFCFAAWMPIPSVAQPAGDDGDDGEDVEMSAENEPQGGNADDGGGPGEMIDPPPPPDYGQTLEGPGPTAAPGIAASRPQSPRAHGYIPIVGLQALLFVAGHPTDAYLGMNFSVLYHFAPKWTASLDLRAAGGMDKDGDHYAHAMGSAGGSLFWWWHAWDRIHRLRPYARVGAGFLGLGDETFIEENEGDDDWDKKSRRFKKNGAPAPGHGGLYTEEAVGVRWVLFPRLWYLPIGGALDVELALVQDFYYGFSKSAPKVSFGLTIFF